MNFRHWIKVAINACGISALHWSKENRSSWFLMAVGLLFLTVGTFVQAQVPGGGAGGGPSQAPAFEDPKFRDKVWEAGGPVVRDSDNRTGKMILKVVIEGNKTVSENAIRTHMQSRPDRVFDKDQLNRDIHALYNTELFERIEPFYQDDADGVSIRIVCHEKPIVKRVVFAGNRAIEDSTLTKNAGIKVNDPISPTTVRSARDRLLDFYRDKGFNDIDIQIKSGGSPGDREAIFRVDEGELERIKSITFVGNQVYSTELLRTKIRCRDSHWGTTPYLFNTASFEKIAEDSKILESYYKSLGYFDTRVEHFWKYDDSGKWIDLTFVISEGERYSVAEVSIQGNRYYDSPPLLSNMELTANNPFVLRKMLNDARFLREVYGAKGFIFVDVTPEMVYMTDHTVKIIYRITEGDVYRASDIRVHIAGDNGHTKHQVILNYLNSIRPGQTLDAREIENAERRLKSTALFVTNPAEGEPPRIEVKPPLDVDLDLP